MAIQRKPLNPFAADIARTSNAQVPKRTGGFSAMSPVRTIAPQYHVAPGRSANSPLAATGPGGMPVQKQQQKRRLFNAPPAPPAPNPQMEQQRAAQPGQPNAVRDAMQAEQQRAQQQPPAPKLSFANYRPGLAAPAYRPGLAAPTDSGMKVFPPGEKTGSVQKMTSDDTATPNAQYAPGEKKYFPTALVGQDKGAPTGASTNIASFDPAKFAPAGQDALAGNVSSLKAGLFDPAKKAGAEDGTSDAEFDLDAAKERLKGIGDTDLFDSESYMDEQYRAARMGADEAATRAAISSAQRGGRGGSGEYEQAVAAVAGRSDVANRELKARELDIQEQVGREKNKLTAIDSEIAAAKAKGDWASARELENLKNDSQEKIASLEASTAITTTGMEQRGATDRTGMQTASNEKIAEDEIASLEKRLGMSLDAEARNQLTAGVLDSIAEGENPAAGMANFAGTRANALDAEAAALQQSGDVAGAAAKQREADMWRGLQTDFQADADAAAKADADAKGKEEADANRPGAGFDPETDGPKIADAVSSAFGGNADSPEIRNGGNMLSEYLSNNDTIGPSELRGMFPNADEGDIDRLKRYLQQYGYLDESEKQPGDIEYKEPDYEPDIQVGQEV